MTADPLLQPYRLRHLELKNRVLSTSHEPAHSEDGMPTQRYVAYHEAKAAGGIAPTMIGGSATAAPDSPPAFGKLDVTGDRIVPHFRVIVGHGTLPLDDVYESLKADSINGGETDLDALLAGRPQTLARDPDGRYRLFRIGDAVASRNIHAALYDAIRLCKDF